MRRVIAFAVALFLLGSHGQPASAAWSLGANLGLTVHHPSGGGDPDVTLIGVPSQSSLFSSLRPGLRIGFAGERRDHEGYADVSYDHQSSEGDSFHAIRLAGNYQYNFAGKSVRPYLTFGVGMFNLGADLGGSVSATSTTYGGGVGLGFPVSEGSGRLRTEVRVDRLGEGKDGSDVLIGKATVFNFAFGFDLWMK